MLQKPFRVSTEGPIKILTSYSTQLIVISQNNTATT